MKRIGHVCIAIVVLLCGRESFAKSGQLKLGINPWPGYEFLFLAQEIGCFKKHGVDLRLVEFSALVDVTNAYIRGQIDGMATTATDAYYAHIRIPQRPLRFLMAIDYSSGADVVIAAPEDNGAKYSFAGKRIGVETMSLGQFYLHRVLQKSGLTIQDVTIVPLAQTRMADALRSKKVDAVVTYPPFLFEALKVKGSKVVFSSAEIPGELLDLLAISEEWTKTGDKDQQLRALVECQYEAVAYRTKNPDEADKIMAKREGITVAEFRTALAGMVMITPDEFKKTIGTGETLANLLKHIENVLKDDKKPVLPWNISEVLAPIQKFQAPLSK